MMLVPPPVRSQPLAAWSAAIVLAFFSASVGLAQGPFGFQSNDVESRSIPRYDVRAENAPFTDRQISYEVRLLDIGASVWRERLKDRLVPVEIEGGTGETAWLLDREQLLRLMKLVEVDLRSNLVQAPKVTAFEGSRATIVRESEQDYVADVEPIRQPGSLAFKPDVKSLTLGTTVEVSGTMRPGEIRLTLDLHDKELAAMHVLRRTAESPDGQITAEYQVPTTTDRRYHLTRSISDGSTLMISLGFQERSGRPDGLTGAAVALLEAAGSPPLEARGETSERLILITPRRIVFKD